MVIAYFNEADFLAPTLASIAAPNAATTLWCSSTMDQTVPARRCDWAAGHPDIDVCGCF
jgi:hypothetical protein